MYRKFTAGNIFTGHEMLDGNFVLITNKAGVVADIVHKDDAGDDIQVVKGLISPGFINAHCHVELSHLKDVIPTGTGLVEFVQQVMSKRSSLEELKIDAMQNAEQEMYDNGIVAVGDICNTTDALLVKQGSKIQWHNFIEVSGFSDGGALQRMETAKKTAAVYLDNQQITSLSPHASYSVSKTLFEQLNITTPRQLITIHNQECAAEDELYQHKTGDFLHLYKNFGIDFSSFIPTGKSSFQSWLPYFNAGQAIISVHNTFISEPDIDFYSAHTGPHNFNHSIPVSPVYFCLCVNANQYIEQKMPPIDLLRKNDCFIVLGTDSYASNTQLNILAEIKTIQQTFNSAIPLLELLQWATINGAVALQMDNVLGSFEKGKKPGIISIDSITGPHINADARVKKLL